MTEMARIRWDMGDARFAKVQKLFAMGRQDKADEGRAILRQLVSEGRPGRRPRRRNGVRAA